MSPKQLRVEEYTIGWIATLPLEMLPARALLDEEHAGPQRKATGDYNSYICGSMCGHNIVMTCLSAGRVHTTSAAIVAVRMLSTFPSIRVGLTVGIGGAAPSAKHDIRLGDIVVSQPDGTLGGVVQYDWGKDKGPGRFEFKGQLNSPPEVLLTAISRIQSKPEEPQFSQFLADMRQKHQKLKSKVSYPGKDKDVLYESDYLHPRSHETACTNCEKDKEIKRPDREVINGMHCPEVYYGIIASGNSVMRNAARRDRIQKETGALCFEMGAAGLMNSFPCLVIRGICNYSDSHKNDDWQDYAAATAAAYAKELLLGLDKQPVYDAPLSYGAIIFLAR